MKLQFEITILIGSSKSFELISLPTFSTNISQILISFINSPLYLISKSSLTSKLISIKG